MELDLPLSRPGRPREPGCAAPARGHARRHRRHQRGRHPLLLDSTASPARSTPCRDTSNLLRIQADEPGRYEGQCNEFCGIGHAGCGSPSSSIRQRNSPPRSPSPRRRETSAMSASVENSPIAARRCGCTANSPRSGPRPWPAAPAAVNHTVIGVRFMVTAFVFFAIGGVLGMLTRVQLATPHADIHGYRRPTTRSSPCTAR